MNSQQDKPLYIKSAIFSMSCNHIYFLKSDTILICFSGNGLKYPYLQSNENSSETMQSIVKAEITIFATLTEFATNPCRLLIAFNTSIL